LVDQLFGPVIQFSILRNMGEKAAVQNCTAITLAYHSFFHLFQSSLKFTSVLSDKIKYYCRERFLSCGWIGLCYRIQQWARGNSTVGRHPKTVPKAKNVTRQIIFFLVQASSSTYF